MKLVRRSGFESVEYFDAESGLQLGSRMTSTSMMGSVPDVVTTYGEYRDFGGILTPITALQRAMGVESLLTLERVEYDTVRDEELRPPPAIAGACGQVALTGATWPKENHDRCGIENYETPVKPWSASCRRPTISSSDTRGWWSGHPTGRSGSETRSVIA